jgi:post-segregation antitoxin (ccd killing protein)
LKITVDDDTHATLVALAKARGITVEQLLIAAAEAEARAAEATEAREMAEQHLARYPELFKRLAE